MNYLIPNIHSLKNKPNRLKFFIWIDLLVGACNIQYKNCRVQFLFPFLSLKEIKGVFLDTLIMYRLSKPSFKVYKTGGFQFLGFGISIEYHVLDQHQIDLQNKLLNKLEQGE